MRTLLLKLQPRWLETRRIEARRARMSRRLEAMQLHLANREKTLTKTMKTLDAGLFPAFFRGKT